MPAKKKGFGEKMKEKMTGMTAEQRQEVRKQEQEYYELHMKFRRALNQAQMTGQPVFLMKDTDGKDIYVEPPQAAYGPPPGAYGGGFQQRGYGGGYGQYGGYGGAPANQYGQSGYGVNPYAQGGPYSNPNAKFIRPQAQYSRQGGGGGLALPLVGGLVGGLLLGDLLF